MGISSGAKLVVALTMIYLLGKSMVATSGVMIIAAFIGSLISMGFVLADLKESKADVHAGGKWYYDWIYLFGCD